MSPREKELNQQLAQCRVALAESQRENTWLRLKMDLLVRRVFGSSSEHLDPAQMELLLALPAAAPVVALQRFNPALNLPPRAPARNAPRAGLTICRWSKK